MFRALGKNCRCQETGWKKKGPDGSFPFFPREKRGMTRLAPFSFGPRGALKHGVMGISLCMIVKNEEDWIENALGSVRSVVDEIIIADTGSTDRTIERAARFLPKVLHFKWTDSFADARNFTLAEARHPWILVLDADECIAARDLHLIREAVQQESDGYHLIQRNYVFGNQIVGWAPNSGAYAEGKSYPGQLD